MGFSDEFRSKAVEYNKTASGLAQLPDGFALVRAKLQSLVPTIKPSDTLESANQELARLQAGILEIAGSIPQNPNRILIAAITGLVTANVYSIMADLTDYLVSKDAMNRVVDKMQEFSDFQKAMRMAVASGDWDAFDKLVHGYGVGTSGASGAGSVGSSANAGDGAATEGGN